MAKIDIEDTLFAELTDQYPNPLDLNRVCTMQLSKLISPAKKTSSRKHCTVNITREQLVHLDQYCALHSMPRNDLLIQIIWNGKAEDVINHIGSPIDAPTAIRHRAPSDGGDRPVSFSPTLECYEYWTFLKNECHASRSLVLYTLLEQFRAAPIEQPCYLESA
jgi:hypothetical protein